MEGRRVADGARSVVAFLAPFASYVNDLRFRLQLPPPRPTSLVLTDQLLAVAAAEATPDHCWSTALLNQANNRVNRGRPAPMAPDLSITAQMITSEQLLCYLLLAKAR
jgi:hypothetical protein